LGCFAGRARKNGRREGPGGVTKRSSPFSPTRSEGVGRDNLDRPQLPTRTLGVNFPDRGRTKQPDGRRYRACENGRRRGARASEAAQRAAVQKRSGSFSLARSAGSTAAHPLASTFRSARRPARRAASPIGLLRSLVARAKSDDAKGRASGAAQRAVCGNAPAHLCQAVCANLDSPASSGSRALGVSILVARPAQQHNG
jgi:hypothetical protein